MSSGTCYVYKHVDPRTQEILYVGKGSGGRAWHFGDRDASHAKYVAELEKLGFGPEHYVKLIDYGMSSYDALRVESRLIYAYQPRFNLGHSKTPRTPQQRNIVRASGVHMRSNGFYYARLYLPQRIISMCGKKEVWRSLKTKDIDEAKHIVRKLIPICKDLMGTFPHRPFDSIIKRLDDEITKSKIEYTQSVTS